MSKYYVQLESDKRVPIQELDNLCNNDKCSVLYDENRQIIWTHGYTLELLHSFGITIKEGSAHD